MFDNQLNDNRLTQQSLQQNQLNTINSLIKNSKDLHETSKKYINNQKQLNKQQQSNTLFSTRLIILFFCMVLIITYVVLLSLVYSKGMSQTFDNVILPIFNLWKSTLDFSLIGALLIFMIFLLSYSSKPKHHYDFREVRIKVWWNLSFWILVGGGFGYFIYKKISDDTNQLVLDDWFYYVLFIISLISHISFWFIFISNKSLIQHEATRSLRKSQKKLQQNEIKNAKKQEQNLILQQKQQNNQIKQYVNPPKQNKIKKLSRNERKKQKLEQKISKLQTTQPEETTNVDELF